MPQREEHEIPETKKDFVLLLNYYEHLVQEWELWGKTVSSMWNLPSE